jgi:hypothetical protein
LTIFTQAFNIETAAYIWDVVLLHGDWEIMRFCLAISLATYKQIKKSNEWLKTLRNSGKFIDINAV